MIDARTVDTDGEVHSVGQRGWSNVPIWGVVCGGSGRIGRKSRGWSNAGCV